MNYLLAILLAALVVSLMLNIYQWYRWHSYRSRAAGSHSYTGMMPAVRVTDKRKKQP